MSSFVRETIGFTGDSDGQGEQCSGPNSFSALANCRQDENG